jgi:hypothetical protein
MNRTYTYFFTRSTEPSEPSIFFSLLRQHLPRAFPKEFHVYEDERVPFTEANLSKFIEFWWDGMFFWKAKRPEIGGHASLGTVHEHTGILHLFETRLADDRACREFLIEVSRRLHADYAFAHVLGDPPFSPEDKWFNGATAFGLQSSLPCVPWAACYGKPYLELFGKENLLSLPLEETREVEPELVFCQLTSRLLDAVDNRRLIQERQAAVYRRLGRDAFRDPQNPDRQGRVPEFPKPVVVRPERKRP